LLEAIFLGLLQGLTEFLPISSSAHIRIAGLFNENASDPGATFTAIIQLGTELAVVIFFRQQIWSMLRNLIWSIFRKENNSNETRLGWTIIIGSLPIVVFGLIFQDLIRTDLRSLWVVALVLIFGGIILGLADRLGRQSLQLNNIGFRSGTIAGFAQALALIPGVSRSAATISAMRALGFNRLAALKFSFLLAIPAVMASGIFELINSLSNPELSRFTGAQTMVATSVSFISGYIVIAWLLRFVERRSFAPFVAYRISLGALLIILLASGTVTT
jgi:undecaprenyl-diphosphatase